MITTSVKRYRAYVMFITFDTQCLSTCIYFLTCRPIVLYLLASCEAELNCHHWHHATPLQTLPPTRCYSINSQDRATKQCKFYTQQFSLPWCLLLTATEPSCVRTQRNTITTGVHSLIQRRVHCIQLSTPPRSWPIYIGIQYNSLLCR